MTNELQTFTRQDLDFMQVLAKHAAASNLYKRLGNESGMLMILLGARELGISPIMALNGGIFNIDGKLEISSRLMNGLIRMKGHKIETVRLSAEGCTLKGTRFDTKESEEASFTMEDSKRAKLVTKDNWVKFTEDMMYARALSRLARRLFPDIIGPAYVEGEIKGEIIDVTPETPCATPDIQSTTPETPPEIPVVELVTPEQAKQIEDDLKKTPFSFYSGFWALCNERYNADIPEKIPASKFKVLVEAIQRNMVKV